MSKKITLPKELDGADAVTIGVCGVWFGNMRPGGNGELHFGMRQSRPTAEVQAALDDLVARGVVSLTADAHGPGCTYRPLINCFDAFRWVLANPSYGIKLTEPISPAEAERQPADKRRV